MPDDHPPLPTGDHVIKQYRQMRPLIGILGLFSRDLRDKAKDLEKQLADVERMRQDRQLFAARFSPMGWTIYDRLSVDAVRAAVAEEDDSLAEANLVTHHLDPSNLEFLEFRFHTSRFHDWLGLYQRAVERLLAEDFLSAVPLILIIIDGICTTKTGKHPFSGGADAPVFDTETSGPGGLSDGLAILGSTRRKLETDPINSPYRHGILHGLNPNFGNAQVSAKAVNLLQTMVDYFDRREDEAVRIAKAAKDQREPSWAELVATMSATQDTKRRIEDWVARAPISGQSLALTGQPNDFEASSPEGVATIYLDAIVARNFGTLARLTIDFPLRTIGYRAGRHRENLGNLKVQRWTITGLRDEAPAISEVDVTLEGVLDDHLWSGSQTMRLIYNDDKFHTLVRGAPDGSWSVMPNFLPSLWGTAIGSRNTLGLSDDDS